MSKNPANSASGPMENRGEPARLPRYTTCAARRREDIELKEKQEADGLKRPNQGK
jgi:hypothetical protein